MSESGIAMATIKSEHPSPGMVLHAVQTMISKSQPGMRPLFHTAPTIFPSATAIQNKRTTDSNAGATENADGVAHDPWCAAVPAMSRLRAEPLRLPGAR